MKKIKPFTRCAVLLSLICLMMNSCFSSDVKNKTYSMSYSIDSLHSMQLGNARPHKSINIELLKRHFERDSSRWIKAFRFLDDKNLVKKDAGRYELDGDNLFVNISDYSTRDEDSCKFESHKKYADIQYLLKGEEQIGLTSVNNLTVSEAYNEIKDIVFYKAHASTQYHLADSTRFFIFFPEDAHRPCVKIESDKPVRKVVIKVRVD